MITTERLDTEVVSALRSLISGFSSLQRAHESTQRYRQLAQTASLPDALDQRTEARLRLLSALHPLLAQFLLLGIAPSTMLYDVPLLMHSIQQAEQQIRAGNGFAGFSEQD